MPHALHDGPHQQVTLDWDGVEQKMKMKTKNMKHH
jgi:hypothetical protein